MIVPMKKVAVITRSIDAGETVKDLRELGVLHVEHQQPSQGKGISFLEEELALVNHTLEVFAKNDELKKPHLEPKKIEADWHIKARHLIDLEKRHEQLLIYAEKLKAAIAEWEEWGDFDPQRISELKEKGVNVSLYEVPEKEIALFPKEAVVKIVFSAKSIAHCIVFSLQKPDVPFKEISLPKQGLSQMKQRSHEDTQVMHSLKDELAEMFHFQQGFLKIKEGLEKELELQQAIKGMAGFGAITYIVGYAPFDKIETLIQHARSKKWGILVEEPKEDDNVPVLLRNPAWVSLISPVFKFLEILPGYRELDISLFFLIFFSIFFGILIGDAGYGLVYFFLAFWLKQKARKANKETRSFYLFYILSFCAIIWGILTGTFFGHEWVIKAGYNPPAPILTDEKGLQRFCFLLGALHLSLAHVWRGWLKAPALSALSEAGWICILWAAFLIAKVLILGDIFPFFGKWLIICGVALVILFTKPQKNILKAIASGLGSLALSLMNNFTDVVSYIRLFAVGMAGIAVADAFNAMAAMVGTANIFTVIAAILIALIGNALGMVLGPVSVLVHGVRLNVLEFSGHASISWSGVRYKPLKE